MNSYKTYFGLILFLLFQACTEKIEFEPRDFPAVKTIGVTGLSDKGATLQGVPIRMGDSPIIDHGFIWSTNPNVVVSTSDLVSLGTLNKSEMFSAMISTRLAKNELYYFRSYMRSEEAVVFGDVLEFNSLGSEGPQLNKFEPERGDLKDTISIIGKGFSQVEGKNVVYFDGKEANIIEIKKDTLIATVPLAASSNQSLVSVVVAGQASSFIEPFELIKPEIDGLNVTEVSFYDPVEVSAPHIPKDVDLVKLYLKNTSGEQLAVSRQNIVEEPFGFILPSDNEFTDFQVVLEYNNQVALSEQFIKVKPIVLTGVSSKKVKYQERVRIYGEGFSPILVNNRAWLDTMEVQIMDLNIGVNSLDYIEVEVPDPLEKNIAGTIGGAYSSREIGIRVETLGRQYNLNPALEINNQWFRLTEPPVGPPIKAVSTGSVAFLFFKEALWRFDGQEWSKLTRFPGNISNYKVVLYSRGSIFVGITSSNNEFWKYSIETNSWEMISALPSNKRMSVVSCARDDRFYILGDIHDRDSPSEFWEYSITTEEWKQLLNPPFSDIAGGAVSIGNVMLVGGFPFEKILSYNFGNETWGEFSNYPSYLRQDAFFVIEDDLFLTGAEYQYSIFKYDFQNSIWIQMENALVDGRNPFVINGKIYTIAYYNERHHFWEFDPTR